jgi:hypothetical protein
MNRQTEEINTLTKKNESLETMVANLQKKIAQGVPTVKPVESKESDSFVNILLARINELEAKLKSVESLQQVLPVPPIPPNITTTLTPPVAQVVKPRSKSMPEVHVKI